MKEIPSSGSMDSFLDELLKDTRACSHTHTCNPPGPDYSHTHTCFHVHTKIVSTSSDDKAGNSSDNADNIEKKTKKRPLGNREAVRKYREKKKARAASLEDEVMKLRAVNQHLLKRLQGQSALEAEVARLKCLLVDIRGRIDGEIGSFPYQKSNKSGDTFQDIMTSRRDIIQYGDQTCSQNGGEVGKNVEGLLSDQGFNGCDFEGLNCFADMGTGSKECPGRGLCDSAFLQPTANSSDDSRIKGGNSAPTVD